MRPPVGVELLVCVVALVVLAAWATTDTRSRAGVSPQEAKEGHYRDGPPPAHTGAFGEPTCQACHFGSELNESNGRLEVAGLPSRFRPGQSYALVVELRRPEIGAAGFQLAVRDSSGNQLGDFELGAGVQSATSDRGIEYVFHTDSGATPIQSDHARWSVVWNSPDDASVSAVISVSANAANGDNSEFGDAVYQTSLVIPVDRTPADSR